MSKNSLLVVDCKKHCTTYHKHYLMRERIYLGSFMYAVKSLVGLIDTHIDISQK